MNEQTPVIGGSKPSIYEKGALVLDLVGYSAAEVASILLTVLSAIGLLAGPSAGDMSKLSNPENAQFLPFINALATIAFGYCSLLGGQMIAETIFPQEKESL